MANKFKEWILPANVGNTTLSAAAYDTDAQRKNGFQAGTVISSSHVNSALRQSSIITCALMNIVAPDNQTLNLQSTVDDVKTVIEDGLKNITVNNSVSAVNANNVTMSIGNRPIENIFEGESSTVKNAINATNATNATKAVTTTNSDNSTNIATTAFVHNLLGFSQDNIMYGGSVVGTIRRQGKTITGDFYIPTNVTAGIEAEVILTYNNYNLYKPEADKNVVFFYMQNGGQMWCTVKTNGQIRLGNTSGVGIDGPNNPHPIHNIFFGYTV